MYVILSQVFTPLLSPLGLCTVLWVVALFYAGRRRQTRAKFCAVVGILLLMFFSNPLVSSSLLGALEADFQPQMPEECPSADAIVVLGGITAPPKAPRVSVHVANGFDRLLHGMRLLRAGKAPVLVLSGGIIGGTISEAEQMRRLAVECGVNPEALLLESDSRNTRENAVNTTHLLRLRGVERVLLVTSASHMRRASAAFARAGANVVPSVTDIEIVPKKWSIGRLVPTVQSLEYSSRAMKEYVGYAVYWIRGWV